MPLRDDVLRKFGPKLLEAFALMILDELNILRTINGLPERTPTQLLTKISNHVTEVPDYNWMQELP